MSGGVFWALGSLDVRSLGGQWLLAESSWNCALDSGHLFSPGHPMIGQQMGIGLFPLPLGTILRGLYSFESP